MAQLTWRELSAPDLSGAIRGQQVAADLISGAIRGAQTGLQNYDDFTTNQVNNQIALRIAAAQDAAQAKAIAAGLVNDPNAARISAQTAALAAARPGALVQLAGQEQNLSDAQYQSQRTRDLNSAVDGSRDAVSRLVQAGISGNREAVNAALADPTLARLQPDAILNLAKSSQGLVAGDVGISGDLLANEGRVISNEGGRIANKQANFNYTTGVRDDADRQSGMQAAAIALRTASSAEDARAILGSYNLSPGAFNTALGGLESRFPGIYGANAMDTGAGGSNTNPLATVNYEARGKGFASVPDNIQTMGQLTDWSKQVNRAGAASSAVGPYQIVGSTRSSVAPKVLGKGWKDMPYSLENERAIAAKIFEDNRGSAQSLRNQWVSLSPQEAERVRQMPTQQALDYIARKESSASPSALRSPSAPVGAAIAAATGIADRQSQDRTNSIIPTWDANREDQRTSGQVANDLLRAGMNVVGENQAQIAKRIEDIQKRTGGNAAQAGEILRQSIRSQEAPRGIGAEIADLFTPRSGSGPSRTLVRRFDDKNIESLVSGVSNGSARTQYLGDVRRQGLQAQIGNAQAASARADAALAQATRRAQMDPAARAVLPKYQADANNAKAAFNRVMREATGSSNGQYTDLPNPPERAKPQPQKQTGIVDSILDFFTPRRGN